MDSSIIEVFQLLSVRLSTTHYKTVSDSLFQALYFAVSEQGKYLPKLFPESTNFPSSYKESIDSDNKFFRSKKESHSHVGRNCGRKFKRGEPIYRCVECEYDNTCVLCVYCFNKNDHIGHQISTSICYDGNSGICDCGDPEAWIVELHCKTNDASPPSQVELFPENYTKTLSKVYKCCLDFIITIFANQNQTNRTIQEKFQRYVNERLDNELKQVLEQELEFNTQIISSHTERAKSDDRYVLTFWNDEYHNFQEAQEAIVHAASVTGEQALNEANHIDKEGRTTLKIADRMEDLINGLRSAFRDRFTASLTTERLFNTEELTKYIIDWILDSIDHPNQEFQKLARRALCDAFCSSYELPIVPYWSNENKIFHGYTGLLQGSKLPGYSPTPTRLQYLIFFDLRFWKVLRRKVHELIVAVLVSDLEYKFIASDQMSQIYDLLLRNLWKIDREPFLTVMDHISVQFYTCPRDSTDIVKNKLHIIFPAVLEFFDSLTHTIDDRRRLILPRRISDPTRARKMTMRRIMQDLAYFFEKSTTMVPLFENKQVFQYFTAIIHRFDDFWTVSRKTGEHVVNENMDYIEYFDTALHFFDIMLTATKVESLKSLDHSLIEESFIELANSIHESLIIHYKSFKDTMLIDYKVSSEAPSFLFLSNHLLTRLFNLLLDSAASYKALTSKIDLLPLADRALRSVVLSKQIQANFWVRNGSVIFHQESIYRDLKSFSSRMSRLDINLIQIAMLTLNPADFFLNILDRFELLDWFQHTVDLDHTIYEDKVHAVIQGLLEHLYVLFTERSNFVKYDSEDKRSHHQLKTALIYTLYDGNKTFDAIEEALDAKLLEEKFFEHVLEEVADFNPPKGLQDDGSFQLKEEYFSKIDPMNLYASGKDLQDILPNLAKKLATSAKKSPDDVIIEPRVTKLEHFKELGEFTRTSHFAKFLVKLLDHANEKKEESYVPLVLHLLHASLKDADLAYGKNHVVQSFFTVPLCEALFSIVNNSDFSKSTVVKADHLLEMLIMKNSNEVMESLKSCFGEDAVTQFKQKKKKISGVDFDETEAERKRRLAKERQRKILEKMKKSSKTFIENYDQEHNDECECSSGTNGAGTKTEEDEDANTHLNECILCRSPEESNKMLCIPVKISRSNVFRDLPHSKPAFIKRAFHKWDEETLNAPSKDDFIGIPFPLSIPVAESREKFGYSINFESSKVMSSCNHGIHHECLSRHMEDNRLSTFSFACPLCKTVHDEYVVSFLKRKEDLTLEELSPESLVVEHEPTTAAEKRRSHNCEVMGGYLMFKTTKLFDFKGVQQMDKLIHDNFGTDYYDQIKFYKRIRQWTTIIGNTISQTEIATRINGNGAYLDLLNQISNQTIKMFRNVLPYYFLVQSEREPPTAMYHKDINRLLIKGSFINAFCLIFFSSADSFHDTAELLVRTFAERYLRTFLKGTGEIGEYPIDPNDVVQNQDNLSYYRNILANSDGNAPATSLDCIERFQKEDDYAAKIVTMIENVMVTNLRQLAIFVKIMVPDFEIKPEETSDKSGTPISILDTLLSSMNLPSYNDCISTHFSMLYMYTTGKDMNFDPTVPYPGVIKLVDLPQELNYFLTNTHDQDKEEDSRFPTSPTSLQESANTRNRVDFSICLVCGHKIFKKTGQRELTQHIKEYSCSSIHNGIFLTPSNNTITLITIMNERAYVQKMNAPYLNTRGQSGPKAIKKGQIAKLNLIRYKHLNELWLGNGVTPLISRSIKRERTLENIFNLPGLNATIQEDEEEDDDDDDDDNDDGRGGMDRNFTVGLNAGPGAVNNPQDIQMLRTLLNTMGDGGFGNADTGERLLQLLRSAGLQVGNEEQVGDLNGRNPNDHEGQLSDDGDFSDEFQDQNDYERALIRDHRYDQDDEDEERPMIHYEDTVNDPNVPLEHHQATPRNFQGVNFFDRVNESLNALSDDNEDEEDYFHDADDMDDDSDDSHDIHDHDEAGYEDDSDDSYPHHGNDDIPINRVFEANEWDSYEETDSEQDHIIEEDGEHHDDEDEDDFYYGRNQEGERYRNLLELIAQRNAGTMTNDGRLGEDRRGMAVADMLNQRDASNMFPDVFQRRPDQQPQQPDEDNADDWVDDSDVSID